MCVYSFQICLNDNWCHPGVYFTMLKLISILQYMIVYDVIIVDHMLVRTSLQKLNGYTTGTQYLHCPVQISTYE